MATNNRLIRVDPEAVPSYPTELKFTDVPLTALRQKARAMLSAKLNPPKILLTEEGLPRDWRGILHCANMHHAETNLIHSHHDPMASILKLWCQVEDGRRAATFAVLVATLGVIDRYDIADDLKETLEEDAKFYLVNKHTSALKNIKETTKPPRTANSDADILTVDDVSRSSQNLPPQLYDAFVLFADEDSDFATDLIEKMENWGLKLCVKERDLIGGVSFEHEAILRLISERCNRLVVICSPAFLQSPANAFFVNFAQALGIEKRRRKIIPCLYQNCEVPPTLSYCFLLKYQRTSKLFNFWEKLRDAIRDTPDEIQIKNKQLLPSITITEVDSPSSTTSESNSNMALHSVGNSDTSPLGTPRSCRDKITTSQSAHDLTITLSDENHNPQPAYSVESCASETPPRKRIMPPPPPMRGSASMVNLGDRSPNGTLMYSNPSLSESAKSIQGSKKMKWYKRILSPSASSNSDLSTATTTKTKKRKWFRKKLASCS